MGFKVLPKRCIAERTFEFIIQSRRLIRDHKLKIDHSGALINSCPFGSWRGGGFDTMASVMFEYNQTSQATAQISSRQVSLALEQSIPLLTSTLARHWSTGQGTRVRHILWSLYTCSHLVNLGDACSGLDARLAEALATAVAAKLILGPEIEPGLRMILQDSGEFDRFDREEVVTPDHLPVVYPPAAVDARSLRKLADSIDRRNASRREGSGSNPEAR